MTNPTTLAVFDFDGTLYRSPMPDGADFNWTNHAFSLEGFGRPGYDWRWVLPVLTDLRRAIADPTVLSVVLTARPHTTEMEDIIRRMLFKADAAPDVLQLKPLESPFSRAEFKATFISSLLDDFPSIKRITFYDDEEENLASVAEVAKARSISLRSFKGLGWA